MTRLEKCELAKEKGYTYDPETGVIYGLQGKIITRKDNAGYIQIRINGCGGLYGHHFAWYMIYKNVDFIELDHINRDRNDNSISNLRISNRLQQSQNSNSRGYSWHKGNNKWISEIRTFGKRIHLGYYKTEEEARHAYLLAKEKYHII
jgi:hypothetical protein